jgi:pyrroline-5-carboxylate reductase
MKTTIAVIGSGNMGRSLIGGLIANGFPAKKIWVSNPSLDKLHLLQQQFGINITQSNVEATAHAKVVILAVKPQKLATVCLELNPLVQEHKPLIISVAAGIQEISLQNWLGGNVAIVRCMPNTPTLIQCGATALYANPHVSTDQHEMAESILRATGITVWLDDEKLLDVVTALSGSGPAHFFLIMESLQEGAEKLGLPSEIARLLTLQTAYGAARMALESEESLTTLRERITSPGGTTERALQVLETANIRQIFMSALQASHQRCKELAKILENIPES